MIAVNLIMTSIKFESLLTANMEASFMHLHYGTFCSTCTTVHYTVAAKLQKYYLAGNINLSIPSLRLHRPTKT